MYTYSLLAVDEQLSRFNIIEKRITNKPDYRLYKFYILLFIYYEIIMLIVIIHFYRILQISPTSTEITSTRKMWHLNRQKIINFLLLLLLLLLTKSV